ncbi:hypothetical protein EON81_17400 [bacterium]|nr:MAG: hypothetical protein EON81_17400 [bacterium]
MVDPRAVQICCDAGCIVVPAPVKLELIGKLLAGLPKSFVIDSFLAAECRAAIVTGSRDDCDQARQRLGIVLFSRPKVSKGGNKPTDGQLEASVA